MTFDHSKLRGRIVERFGTCRAFCAEIGYKNGILSTRLAGTTPFRADEIRCFCEALEIPDAEVAAYFFTPKVR